MVLYKKEVYEKGEGMKEEKEKYVEVKDRHLTDKGWIKLWQTYGVHPNKSIMVDMIGRKLNTHVSGLYRCDALTIARIWMGVCCNYDFKSPFPGDKL
jgi:hypothetical protein